MKRFILNSVKTALVLSAVSIIFDQIGPKLAGDYFTPIRWGIIFMSIVVLAFVVWRFHVGIQSGHLLFDDLDE